MVATFPLAGSEDALETGLMDALAKVRSWQEFMETTLSLDPETLVPETERLKLDALPSMIRLYGDGVPIDYEVSEEAGYARLRLREGQARRLVEADVPALDRPVRFAVVQGRGAPLLADSLADLQRQLAAAARRPAHDDARRRPARRGGAKRGGRRGGRR
jgi:hypothetical protein